MENRENAEQKRTIRTKTGRDVEITEKNIILVKDGLLGFDGLENYALIPHGGDDSPFLLLQSLDEPDLAFITIDPRLFAADYVPDLSAEDIASLGIPDIAQAVVLAIVVIPDDPRRMTANLQGPVIINVATRTGRQMISRSVNHKVRHYILGDPAAALTGNA